LVRILPQILRKLYGLQIH